MNSVGFKQNLRLNINLITRTVTTLRVDKFSIQTTHVAVSSNVGSTGVAR